MALVNKHMKELREENVILRKELKQIKNRVRKIFTPINKKEIYTQTPSHSIDLTSKKDKKTKDKRERQEYI